MNKNLVVAIVLFVLGFYLWANKPTQAQDAAPAWEYMGVIYANENAQVFTGDIGSSLDMNKMLDPGITIIEAFNIIGANGWEFVGIKEDNTPNMYLFKRPKG